MYRKGKRLWKTSAMAVLCTILFCSSVIATNIPKCGQNQEVNAAVASRLQALINQANTQLATTNDIMNRIRISGYAGGLTGIRSFYPDVRSRRDAAQRIITTGGSTTQVFNAYNDLRIRMNGLDVINDAGEALIRLRNAHANPSAWIAPTVPSAATLERLRWMLSSSAGIFQSSPTALPEITGITLQVNLMLSSANVTAARLQTLINQANAQLATTDAVINRIRATGYRGALGGILAFIPDVRMHRDAAMLARGGTVAQITNAYNTLRGSHNRLIVITDAAEAYIKLRDARANGFVLRQWVSSTIPSAATLERLGWLLNSGGAFQSRPATVFEVAGITMQVNAMRPSMDGVQTNFALFDAIVRYFYEVAIHLNNPTFNATSLVPNARQVAESNHLKGVIVSALEQDTWSVVLPFGMDFVRYVFSYIHFHVAPSTAHGGFVNGGIIGSGERIVMRGLLFVNNNTHSRNFAFVMLHEIGHLFGLGESLTNLFAAELMRPSLTEQHFGSPRVFTGATASNWADGIHWDWPLLMRAGAIAFWHAAFTSQIAYEALWNRHFPQLPFRQVLNARSLSMSQNRALQDRFFAQSNFGEGPFVDRVRIPTWMPIAGGFGWHSAQADKLQNVILNFWNYAWNGNLAARTYVTSFVAKASSLAVQNNALRVRIVFPGSIHFIW